MTKLNENYGFLVYIYIFFSWQWTIKRINITISHQNDLPNKWKTGYIVKQIYRNNGMNKWSCPLDIIIYILCNSVSGWCCVQTIYSCKDAQNTGIWQQQQNKPNPPIFRMNALFLLNGPDQFNSKESKFATKLSTFSY